MENSDQNLVIQPDNFPRSARQHRAFLSGRAESTSAADKSQEILPPQNLRQGPSCDNENLNKVYTFALYLYRFLARGS